MDGIAFQLYLPAQDGETYFEHNSFSRGIWLTGVTEGGGKYGRFLLIAIPKASHVLFIYMSGLGFHVFRSTSEWIHISWHFYNLDGTLSASSNFFPVYNLSYALT